MCSIPNLTLLSISVRNEPKYATHIGVSAVEQHRNDDEQSSLSPELHYDVLLLVVKAMLADDACTQIRNVFRKVSQINRDINKICKSDAFWKLACEVHEYDRNDRITGYHKMDGPDTNMPWKKQFCKWCRLRFNKRLDLKNAVNLLLKKDPIGAENLDPFGPIASWDVSKVEDMSYMFNGATSFNGDVSKWKFPKVENMSHMFYGAASFNGDVSRWTFPEVMDMSYMFDGATSFNGDVSKWDFPKVMDMRYMFKDAMSFDGDVSKWTFPHAEEMEGMFMNAKEFKGNGVENWEFPNVFNMEKMFKNAKSFNGDITTWKGTFDVKVSEMFAGATNFNGNLSDWLK